MGYFEHHINASWACTVFHAELLLGLPFREFRLCDIYTTQDCSDKKIQYCQNIPITWEVFLESAQQGSCVNLQSWITFPLLSAYHRVSMDSFGIHRISRISRPK